MISVMILGSYTSFDIYYHKLRSITAFADITMIVSRESTYSMVLFLCTGNKLLVMNMSQQTDSSDLLGG